jgi:CBS domain-containing protein
MDQSEERSGSTVRDLLQSPVVWTVPWETPMRDAAEQMASRGIGCLPVVADDDPRKVLGIVTRADLVRALLHFVLQQDPREVGVEP